MKPTTLTIFELFEKERRYTVPLFQRPYVWERQWAHLWQDVITRADAILNRGDDTYALRRHFLGAVVLNQLKTFGRQVPGVEVIDGQQRLTTLQILLIALRDFLRARGDESYDRTLIRLTENTCRMETPVERFKVWPTNADRQVFEAVVTAGSIDGVDHLFPLRRRKYTRKYEPRPRLVEAYLYFYREIASYVDAKQDEEISNPEARTSRNRIDALVEALSHHLELVMIELEERDDPQAIFESLNGLGEPLLPSDLIRNFIFQQAVMARLSADDLYDEHWKHFDSADFWQVEERQGRLKRRRFDLFIFHYLVKETERDLNIGQLYQDFKDWWYSSARDVTLELMALERQSEIYRTFLEPERSDSAQLFLERLKVIDTSTIYPVLLYLLDNQRAVPVHEVRRTLTIVESYLVRRMVCGLTQKNYNRVFLLLLKLVKRQPDLNSEIVRDYLLSLEGDSVRWPDDAEFRQAWLSMPLYTTLGPAKMQMVLKALNRSLHSRFQEDVSVGGWLSVEHIMPQQADETNWPLPEHDPTDYARRGELLRLRGSLIHTIGNLTLLTGYLNSSISNGPFEQKRSRIAEQSALRLNTYFQTAGDSWDEAAVLRRGEELFRLAREIWPRLELP